MGYTHNLILNNNNNGLSPAILNNTKNLNNEELLLNENGMNWVITGLFVVGVMAGGGLVALPTAMLQTGFIQGLILTAIITLTVTYTSHVLGKSWVILRQRWPNDYCKKHCRKPYPEIAYRAIGPKMKPIVSFCINITQFGIAVVYLVLVSKNLRDFLKAFFGIDVSFCIIALILAVIICPITLFKSPQDFWGAVVLAMFTTSLAVIFILLGASYDYELCSMNEKQPKHSFLNFFLALGTFIFAYGGHAAFPTIQHDMKKPSDFTKSSIMAFLIIAIMYVPVSILGYITYGDSLRESIINSLQIRWIQQSVNMLITVHCVLTLTIMFNPLNQEAEELLHVPHHFCLKRVIVRGGMMALVLFVAETVPNFGPLLGLIGGSTVALTSLVFPCLFYIYLEAGERIRELKLEKLKYNTNNKNNNDNGFGRPDHIKKPKNNEEWATIKDVLMKTNKTTLICCSFVIVFGLITGVAATFSAIREMSYAHFVPPCYLNLHPHFENDADDSLKILENRLKQQLLFNSTKLTKLKSSIESQTNCCGIGQNLTHFGDPEEFCSKPNLNFYT